MMHANNMQQDNFAIGRDERPAKNMTLLLSGNPLFAPKEYQGESHPGSIWRDLMHGQDWVSSISLAMIICFVGVLSVLGSQDHSVVNEAAPATFDTAVFSDDALDLRYPDIPMLREWVADVDARLQSIHAQKHVVLMENEEGISLNLNARVLFNDGAQDIARSGLALLDSLKPLLLATRSDLHIEVYSDSRAISLKTGLPAEYLRDEQANAVLEYFKAEKNDIQLSSKAYSEADGRSDVRSTRSEKGKKLWSQRVTLQLQIPKL